MQIIFEGIAHDYARVRSYIDREPQTITHQYQARGSVWIDEEEYDFELPLTDAERKQIEEILHNVKVRVGARFAQEK